MSAGVEEGVGGPPQPRADIPKPAENSLEAAVPLLKRLITEVVALRKEFSSDLRPEIMKSGEALKSLESYIYVKMVGHISDILKAEVATSFDAAQKRSSRGRRLRLLVLWAMLLLVLGMLIAEIRSDAVTQWIERLSALI